MKACAAAGIDGIQHPEILDGRELPDDVVATIKGRNVICSMLVNTITGPAWQRHVKAREEALKKAGEAAKDAKPPARQQTTAEKRKAAADAGDGLEVRRANAVKLAKSGAIVTPGTDSYWAAAPELTRAPKMPDQDHGMGTILAIEGFVELGLTPAQAIVAATKNGAIAARGLKDFGTLEAGKFADLVVLTADPLADIHNIRKVATVMKGGKVVDRAKLPATRVLSVAK